MSETGCGSSTQLIATALQLGTREVPGWSVAEERLARGVSEVSAVLPGETRQQILAGGDPLGTAFCNLRSSAERRGRGAVYTPHEIVTAMLDWLEPVGTVARIVDPGCGSGRFLIEAGKRFPSAKLLGIELDPLAALLSRANLAVNGMSKRAEIHVADYCEFKLPPAPGRTLFLGNPPYVRHHQLTRSQKDWLTAKAAEVGIPVSRLSGLHLYFYLATFLKSNAGDVGCFITAAEWMEVNYGKFLRRLLLEHLGGQRLALLEPAANPFPDAATTAAIVQFEVGKHPEEIPFQRCGSVSDIIRSRRVRLIDRKDFQRDRSGRDSDCHAAGLRRT